MFSGYRFALLGGGELVLMLFHPHARSMEDNAFRLQPDSLFEAVFARERDLSFSAHHAVPGQPPRRASERPDYLTSTAWKTRRPRDVAVSRNLAFRYFPNGVANDFKHDALLWRTHTCVALLRAA